jgi:hypothetical protein
MPKRSLLELLNTDEPAWPLVQTWLREATNPVEVLPPSDPARGDALVATQVTTRSPMGAIIYETGGLLVDHGWLRLLGSGHPRLPRSLPEWNRGRSWREGVESPPFLLIADDVVGGFFAVNGGGLGEEVGQVHYFVPDGLAWDSLGAGYTDFLLWCLGGDLAGFYADYRWPGWEDEVKSLPGDRAFSIYPPPFTRGPAFGERHRGAVPLDELYRLYVDEFARQPGDSVQRPAGYERGDAEAGPC